MTGPRGADFLHVEAQQVLPDVLTALELERPVLVGHSDGACIALIHAGTPELENPAAIALLAPHVIIEPVAFAGVEIARAAYQDGRLRERLARHHDRPDELFHAWAEPWATPEFEDWSLTDLIPNVQCPVLLLQGVDDQYGTLEQLDLTERLLPPSVPRRRIDLEESGHHPHLEHPDTVTAALVELIAGT